jgi:hypothetical protein
MKALDQPLPNLSRFFERVHGARVARLTPDQQAGSSNLSGLTFRFSHFTW